MLLYNLLSILWAFSYVNKGLYHHFKKLISIPLYGQMDWKFFF